MTTQPQEGSLLLFPSQSECFEDSGVLAGKHVGVALLREGGGVWSGGQWRVCGGLQAACTLLGRSLTPINGWRCQDALGD